MTILKRVKLKKILLKTYLKIVNARFIHRLTILKKVRLRLNERLTN
jgi:hypothetical protein